MHNSQSVRTSPDTEGRRIRLCGRTTGNEPYSDPVSIEEPRETCVGMLAAIDAECLVMGTEIIRLGSGSRRRVVSGGSVYLFTADEPFDASGGDPVLFRLRLPEVEDVIVSCCGQTIELVLTDDIGSAVSDRGELLLGAPWLLVRLRQRVSGAFEIGHRTPRVFHFANGLRTVEQRFTLPLCRDAR